MKVELSLIATTLKTIEAASDEIMEKFRKLTRDVYPDYHFKWLSILERNRQRMKKKSGGLLTETSSKHKLVPSFASIDFDKLQNVTTESASKKPRF